jgi:hypothetical protein
MKIKIFQNDCDDEDTGGGLGPWCNFRTMMSTGELFTNAYSATSISMDFHLHAT